MSLVQDKVSVGTSSTILRGLQPDTVYRVSLVPVYAEGDGKTVSENGKTSERPPPPGASRVPARGGLMACLAQGRWWA